MTQPETKVNTRLDVLDPTANVLQLVAAAVERLEDLRVSEVKRNDDNHVLNSKYVDAQILHLKEISDLRATHAKEIRESEADRLDKIRQVDVLAAVTAAASAATAIQALAATTDRNAENLRNQLNTTAATIAKQTSDSASAQASQQAGIVLGINDRLATLEKASYQGAGQKSVSDPQLAGLIEKMEKIITSQGMNTGEKQGKNQVWGYVFGGIMALIAIITYFSSHPIVLQTIK